VKDQERKITISSLDDYFGEERVSVETLTNPQLRQRCYRLEEQLCGAIHDHQRTKLLLAQYEESTWCTHCEKKVKLRIKMGCCLCKECNKIIRE
jgi:hypothetical protein